jgi:hypothetical protein
VIHHHPPLTIGTRVRIDAGHHVSFGKIAHVSDMGISILREEGEERADTYYPWSRVHFVRRAAE